MCRVQGLTPWNPGIGCGVCPSVPDWLTDLLLPTTDRAATTQWIVMAAFWTVVIAAVHRLGREVSLLAIGGAVCTLAWFLLRMAH